MISEHLSELNSWPPPLCFFLFQPPDLSKSCLLLTLPQNTHLLFFHLSLLPLPYSFTRSQPLQPLLCLAQLQLPLLSVLYYPRVSLFQLESANWDKTLVKVLVFHVVDTRVCWRTDLDAVFELQKKHLGKNNVVVRVCHLNTISKSTGWRGWAGVIIWGTGCG